MPIATLPIIPTRAFDYAILSLTIQATRQPQTVLENLLRIGRRAIVSFPNFGHWQVRGQLLFTGRMPVTREPPGSLVRQPKRAPVHDQRLRGPVLPDGRRRRTRRRLQSKGAKARHLAAADGAQFSGREGRVHADAAPTPASSLRRAPRELSYSVRVTLLRLRGRSMSVPSRSARSTIMV